MMKKVLGFGLLMAAISGTCLAGLATVPELDPASGTAAIGLIGGALLILRARRKK